MAERIRLQVQEHLGYRDQTLSAQTVTKPSQISCPREVALAQHSKLQQEKQRVPTGDQTHKNSQRQQWSKQDKEDVKNFVDLIKTVGTQKRRRNLGFLRPDEARHACPTTTGVPPRQCGAGDPVG